MTINPTNYRITDPTFTTDQVTGMNILVGSAAGGPYNQAFAVPAAALASQSGGVVNVDLKTLAGWSFANGTYFTVATAVNASGTSPHSPEASFQSLSVPSAPSDVTLT